MSGLRVGATLVRLPAQEMTVFLPQQLHTDVLIMKVQLTYIKTTLQIKTFIPLPRTS